MPWKSSDLFNHLRDSQHPARHERQVFAQDDLEEGAGDARRVLYDERLVGYERERRQLAARYVRLQQDVDLAVRVLAAAAHRQLAVRVQVIVQLVQLVVAHLQLVKLLGHGNEGKDFGVVHRRVQFLVEDLDRVVFDVKVAGRAPKIRGLTIIK